MGILVTSTSNAIVAIVHRYTSLGSFRHCKKAHLSTPHVPIIHAVNHDNHHQMIAKKRFFGKTKPVLYNE